MRAYVVASGLRIAPWGDPVAEVPIGGVPLGARQDALLRRFGLDVVHVARLDEVPTDEPRLVTYDHVYYSRRVLKSALSRWKKAGQVASRLALPVGSTFVQRFSALQDFERTAEHALFDLWLLPAGASTASAAPLPVIYAERLLSWPVPPRISGTATWVHPVTSSVVFHVRHWLHVLQASLLSIQIRWVDEVVSHPLWALSLLARAAIGRGRLAWRIGGVANRYGRDVDVHPTARVEGSFLGDGVRVGPHALVRGAIVGAGSVIEQAADVSYSVLGQRCFVSKHSLLWAIVAHDEAELCMKGMQMCLVGRGAALTARATPLDVMPGRALRVRDGDRFVEIDVPVLGACFGHDTFVGADVYTGPGREVPNGTRIVPDPARVLSKLPAELDPTKLYVVRDGTLVALP